jgi:uncharacterized protein YndB with AHSA1/START domain
MQDSIEREITVKAPAAQVYQAITDPEQITNWFPDTIEGTLAVGERPVLGFGEHGKTQIYVVDAKPFEYFAYRWVPGSAGNADTDVMTVPNTLVEFHIAESADGTKVTVKESGFAALPEDRAENSFKENSGGWEYMMGRLEKFMNEA